VSGFGPGPWAHIRSMCETELDVARLHECDQQIASGGKRAVVAQSRDSARWVLLLRPATAIARQARNICRPMGGQGEG
jgi:hypothetical protein